MLMRGRITPNNWGTTHSSLFWQCLGTVLATLGVSFSLQIGGLRFSWIWLVILDTFDFNRFTLCPWVMSFFQKLSPAPFLPVSCLTVKASVYNAGNLGSIPGSGRFPGDGNGNPFPYSCLENPMDRGAWCPWGHKESDTIEQLSTVLYTQLLSKWLVYPLLVTN